MESNLSSQTDPSLTSAVLTISDAGLKVGQLEEEYIPFSKAAQVIRPRQERWKEDRSISASSHHHSASSNRLPSSAAQEMFDPRNEATSSSSTTVQDDDHSSNYASDNSSSTPNASDQDIGPVSQRELLMSMGIPILPLELSKTNVGSFVEKSAQARAIRQASTVTHLHRSAHPAVAPIHTLRPDAVLRADPQDRVRDYILDMNAQWTETRDATIAAPLLAELRDHEAQLRQAHQAAQVAQLHSKVAADKAWLLKKLYLRSRGWLAARMSRREAKRRGASVRARLNRQYVAQQLAHRKDIVEALFASAVLEMSSGDKGCGRMLRDAYSSYLSENAGRIVLPVRAELDAVEDGEAARAPRWLASRSQVIDRGDGRQEAFIVRYFC